MQSQEISMDLIGLKGNQWISRDLMDHQNCKHAKSAHLAHLLESIWDCFWQICSFLSAGAGIKKLWVTIATYIRAQ